MCNMMLTEESLKVMDAMTNVCSLSSPLPLLSFFSHTYNSNSHPQDTHALERDAVEGQQDNAQISMSKVSVCFCQLCLFDSTKEKAFWYLGDVQKEVCTTYIHSPSLIANLRLHSTQSQTNETTKYLICYLVIDKQRHIVGEVCLPFPPLSLSLFFPLSRLTISSPSVVHLSSHSSLSPE